MFKKILSKVVKFVVKAVREALEEEARKRLGDGPGAASAPRPPAGPLEF